MLTLWILLGLLFSTSFAYGDNIPLHGRWDTEDYRSISALPPVLSIDGHTLSVHFTETLEDLRIRVTDNAGSIICEDVLSGEANEVINIPLEGIDTGLYQVAVTHRLGWLVGEFEIK